MSTLVLAVPVIGPTWSIPIAAGLVLFAMVTSEGPLFDLFALPADRAEGRLYGLAVFVLAATVLGIIAETSTMSTAVFVGTVLLLGYGNLTEQLASQWFEDGAVLAGAFVIGGTVFGVGGHAATRWIGDPGAITWLPEVVFLAVSGALLAALLRQVLISYDDPVVMLAVGVLLWLLERLEPGLGQVEVLVAVAVVFGLGIVAYGLGTASVAGMLTGVLLGLLTIVLGGVGWFLVLISFFAIGGLATKFRYEEKVSRGVAEANEGARGSGNVLSNSAIALVAVLGYAAAGATVVPIDPGLFLFAFVGAVATALSDTLSSEIGGVYDGTRLVTTLEPVEPGTDGGITWQGQLAGLAGGSVVAGITVTLFPEVGVVGAVVIVGAGFLGMTVDSLLGATVEGRWVGNQSVNFLATLAGALFGAGFVLV